MQLHIATERPRFPPTYTVAQLVRAEVVRAYAGSCSSPALTSHLRTNLLARWSVGLPLFGPTPSPDTLERFNAWLCTHHPDALFRDVLAFLDRVDPEDPATTPQIVDTFALQSPAAPQSPAVVLMRLTAKLASLWLALHPADAWPVLPPDLDLHRLRTARASRSKEKGQRQLAHAVATARQVVAALEPLLPLADDPLPEMLPTIIAQIAQVIAAETTTAAAGAGTAPALDRYHRLHCGACATHLPDGHPAGVADRLSDLPRRGRVCAVVALSAGAYAARNDR
jgi:hypothetical protein